MKLEAQQDNSFTRLIKNFFNTHELWGRQNRNQFFIGLICTAGYFLTNIFLIVKLFYIYIITILCKNILYYTNSAGY